MNGHFLSVIPGRTEGASRGSITPSQAVSHCSYPAESVAVMDSGPRFARPE